MKKKTAIKASALAILAGCTLLAGCETAPPVREYTSHQYYGPGGYMHRTTTVRTIEPVGERIVVDPADVPASMAW
ncbi:MAG: hypothetical protein WCP06_02035 [Verrucomicrobiota bacterium]